MLRPLLVGLVAGCLALPPTTALAVPPAKGNVPRVPGRAECAALPAAGQTIPWKPGERLTYDIDVMGAQAGKLALVALPPVGKGASAEYPLRALAASNSFFSKIRRVRGRSTSYVRARDMHPRRYEEASQEGKLTKSANVVFKRATEGRQVQIEYKRNNAKGKRNVRYLNDAFDPVSTIYYLRTLDFRDGMPVCFDSYGIRRLWRVTGSVKGVETVKVPAGVFQAWHIEGVAVRTDDPYKRREVHVWITNDERRLPVASLGVLDLGAVRAQLTHVGEGGEKDSEDTLIREEPTTAATPTKASSVQPTAAPATAPAQQPGKLEE